MRLALGILIGFVLAAEPRNTVHLPPGGSIVVDDTRIICKKR